MLEIEGLSKSFGEITAVDNVSFNVKNGEFLTLVGPSGCGKTTLLKMLAGHISPDGGEITLDNDIITNTSPTKRPTSLVFQSLALFPHLTVEENIRFPMEARGLDNGSPEKFLKQVELDPATHGSKKPGKLSGGQQQRVAIARSLAFDPEILLLDEPLTSLDYLLQRKLRRELVDMNKRLEKTFIYVTHSLEAALLMSDRLFVMNNGKIIQKGTPESIYQTPNSRFVAEFMGDANILDIRVVNRSNGKVRIEGPEFEDPVLHPEPSENEPDCLVVRHDECLVDYEKDLDYGIEVEVTNVLVNGNTYSIEVESLSTGNEYVSVVDQDLIEKTNLARGDHAILQWDSRDSKLLPTKVKGI